MQQVAITGTGLYTPSQAISNEELVAAFNQYVDLYNEENAAAIAEGKLPPSHTLPPNSLPKRPEYVHVMSLINRES